jgi:FMN phosphatase YigB (HAD superfamily)
VGVLYYLRSFGSYVHRSAMDLFGNHSGVILPLELMPSWSYPSLGRQVLLVCDQIHLNYRRHELTFHCDRSIRSKNGSKSNCVRRNHNICRNLCRSCSRQIPMIKIAFFDVGETLIHNGVPFPGVAAALTAVAGFETADGQMLIMGIISDYHMPSPPGTEEKIAALEEQYRSQVLGPSKLAGFFEPFESRVTISSRAGAPKPDRKIFEIAVARIGTGASLSECLFVTENTTHLEKCKEYGMTPIRFGSAVNGMAGFEDWSDAPAAIAGLVAPGHAGNQRAAAAAALAARHGLLGFDMIATDGRSIYGRANQLFELNDPRLGPLDGVFVERPSDVRVDLASDGRITNVVTAAPEPDEVADAVDFVSSLIKSGRVAIPGQKPSAFGVTHMVETDSEGRMRLVRRGYSGH